MFKHIAKLSFLLSFILNQNLFCSSSSSSFVSSDSEPAGMTIDEIRTNTDLLRQIALAIFNEQRVKKHINDKICPKHSVSIVEPWKSYSSGPRPKIPGINSSYVRDIMNSSSLGVVFDVVFTDDYALVKEMINLGDIKIDTPSQKGGGKKIYNIRISHSFGEEVGAFYPDRESNGVPTKKLYIAFDANEIIYDIIEGRPWDKNMGSVSTICVDEKLRS